MAELGGAADAGGALGEAAEQADQRQFVDRRRDLGGDDRGSREVAVAAAQRADRLAPLAARLDHLDVGAHPVEDPEQADPRRVDPDALDADVAAGHDQRRGEVEGGRREVAGNRHRRQRDRRRRLDPDRRGDRVEGQARPLALDLDVGTGCGEHPLGVVTGRGGLADRRQARGEQPRQEDARLHLRGGDRQLVVDRPERSAGDRDRRAAAAGRPHRRIHGQERLGDTSHRPGPDRLVAVEHERALLLARQQAGEQADQRAGVADVDRAGGRLRRSAEAEAGDLDVERAGACRLGPDRGAERLDRG